MNKALKWDEARSFLYPEFCISFSYNLEIEVFKNAPLSSDFDNGDIKLIPVIFSHGLIASKNYYSTHCRELAS